jgi:hypothetical protein
MAKKPRLGAVGSQASDRYRGRSSRRRFERACPANRVTEATPSHLEAVVAFGLFVVRLRNDHGPHGRGPHSPHGRGPHDHGRDDGGDDPNDPNHRDRPNDRGDGDATTNNRTGHKDDSSTMVGLLPARPARRYQLAPMQKKQRAL